MTSRARAPPPSSRRRRRRRRTDGRADGRDTLSLTLSFLSFFLFHARPWRDFDVDFCLFNRACPRVARGRPAPCVPCVLGGRPGGVCAQVDWKKEMQTDSDFLCRCCCRYCSPCPPSVGKQTICLLLLRFPPFSSLLSTNPNRTPCLVNGRFLLLRILRDEWRKRRWRGSSSHRDAASRVGAARHFLAWAQ